MGKETMPPAEWAAAANQLAAESLRRGDPTGWFELLYAAGHAGESPMPWDRGTPRGLLVRWAGERGVSGHGRRAVVVGCGLGHDAEFIPTLGYDTVAFDISETAIRLARERFADGEVDYVVADLFDLPSEWDQAFDLVVEIQTVQALPDPARSRAIAGVSRLVAPGGTLVVIAYADEDQAGQDRDGTPPWPLTRAEIDAFAVDGVRVVRADVVDDPEFPGVRRWVAEFRRGER